LFAHEALTLVAKDSSDQANAFRDVEDYVLLARPG
jgi:hypothetical protein